MEEPSQEEIKRQIERDKLFFILLDELDRESPAVRYQRMRYEREIEAAEYMRLLRAGFVQEKAIIEARKKADIIVLNWKGSST